MFQYWLKGSNGGAKTATEGLILVCLVVIFSRLNSKIYLIFQHQSIPPTLPKHSSQLDATQTNYPHSTKIHYQCRNNTSFEDCKTQHQIECIKGKWLPQKMIKSKGNTIFSLLNFLPSIMLSFIRKIELIYKIFYL